MSDDKLPERPEAVPYADPSVPTGASGFRQMQYPSDYAGFWNPSRFQDDGTVLRLRPGSLRWRLMLMAVVGVTWAALPAVVRFTSRPRYPCVLVVWAVVCLSVLLLPGVSAARGRRLTPWIEVDRARKRVRLPREKREVSFGDVVRLQVVTFSRVGWSPGMLGYHPAPGSGEVQIVFKGAGGEQTWCVVAWPDAAVLRRFAVAFRDATGAPVSRAYPLANGEWMVEPFDQVESGGAAARGAARRGSTRRTGLM